MRTLGVDLSADPRKSAACLLDWRDGAGVVEELAVGAQRKGGLQDEDLLGLAERADKVGIDAPLGYPAAFIEAVMDWASQRAWPTTDKTKLRYRATDSFVAARARRPLSVSSERIAATAWRAARLLTALEQRTGEVSDRAGNEGRVVEVYPAASLVVWGLSADRYKGAENATTRAQLLRELADLLIDVAPVSEVTRSACEGSDDAFDAVVASLSTRAAALGLTLPPETDEERALAQIEGWIALPEPGSLSRLASS